MSDDKEKKNQDYLKSILSKESGTNKKSIPKDNPTPQHHSDSSGLEFTNISLDILPAARYYKNGTKISIRAAKVSEIQAYSMVDDNNFVDITEKMNELLSRCLQYTHPDGSKGGYRNVKDSDRIFLIFMIRELTFQGGNTLTKEVTCPDCDNVFNIPFRSTPGNTAPSTFELYEPNESIEDFYDNSSKSYQLIDGDVAWELSPPSIGIQEDFYTELKGLVQSGKKPDVAFMKIMPFLLGNRDSISEKEIKDKLKEFKEMDDLDLFQALNEIVDNMKIGIKGLKMKCPECGQEVHTEITFPGGASTLFKIPDILSRFRKRN